MSLRQQSKSHVIAAVVASVVGSIANADISNIGSFAGPGTEFVVSTSGATALGAFTRGNTSSGGAVSGYFRGPFALGGPSLQIGQTLYTPQVAGPQYYGSANRTSPNVANEPGSNNDRIAYYYRESGSVQGILDLCDSNGLLVASGGNSLRPGDPSTNLFLWVNGNRFSAPNSSGNPSGGNWSIGQNYLNGTPANPQTGQELVRIAWSDVRFEQAFSNSTGAAGATKKPLEAGYGRGRGNVGGTNFQQLRDQSAITGGIDPTTTRLRNETLAVVPFNIVANPGTGLTMITKEDGKWLQASGRLANGANFNSVTREFGSGTRNQGDLNLGLDPSWGAGERDRRYLGASPLVGGTGVGQRADVKDNNGNYITINPGDEMKPELSLLGSTIQDVNENRVSPLVRFADKISGSSGVRATVVASRMGVGILSSGDSRDNTNGTALNTGTLTSAPMRALRIDFNNGKGALQGTVANVSSGDYMLWSQSQAITVAPYANPAANDVGANAYKPINGDQNDLSIGSATSSTQVGLHRKFLDNITGSVSTYSTLTSTITPADFIINAAFVPPQIMKVSKEFDGGAESSRTLSTVDPDGAGPVLSEQALYDAVTASNGSGQLYNQTNWAKPELMNGNIGVDNGVTYKIFATANTGGTANRLIGVNSRTVLAGDFNGDTVRDLQDVSAMAYAYANPTAYVNTPASGDANGRNYNGVAVQAGVGTTTTGANASVTDGLIVLSDFNANGNVANDVNSASFATQAVERADIRFFLYGATVDTSAFNVGTTLSQDGGNRTLTAIENRRENGVRLGDLKKNAAIGTFNATLDSYVGNVLNPATSAAYTQNEVNAMKFSKYDVNGDSSVGRDDAKIVDRNVGKNYTSFDDVMSSNDDLVAAELNDDKVITHIVSAGYSDFKDIRDALGSGLLDGDANFDGTVSSLDFDAFVAGYGATGRKWSEGDFSDFDGKVTTVDFNRLAGNFGQVASGSIPGAALGSVVPEPASISLMVLAASASLRRRR